MIFSKKQNANNKQSKIKYMKVYLFFIYNDQKGRKNKHITMM